MTYDGKPSYTVSIMEFSGEKVARETQYFADPFHASTGRALNGSNAWTKAQRAAERRISTVDALPLPLSINRFARKLPFVTGAFGS